MQPLVTIIINNYNYERFLAAAIDSALNQSYQNIEVIVVDDDSKDNSKAVIACYGTKIKSVFKENGGQASALNSGFRVSQGDIILLLDADDYLFPDAVFAVVEAWNPGISQIQARLELVDINGQYIDLYPAPELPFDSGDVKPLLLTKGRYRTTVTSGTSFSRNVLEEIMPIPEPEFKISADGYLVTVAPLYGPVVSIEKPLGARRKHGENLWAASNTQNQSQRFRKSVEHDFLRYQFLAVHANQQNLKLKKKPGLRDYVHLTQRIASLRTEPKRHPIPSDSLVRLSIQGVISVLRYANLPVKRKIVLSAWFICVGLLPHRLAMLSLDWLLFPQSRSSTVDNVLKKVRFATR